MKLEFFEMLMTSHICIEDEIIWRPLKYWRRLGRLLRFRFRSSFLVRLLPRCCLRRRFLNRHKLLLLHAPALPSCTSLPTSAASTRRRLPFAGFTDPPRVIGIISVNHIDFLLVLLRWHHTPEEYVMLFLARVGAGVWLKAGVFWAL